MEGAAPGEPLARIDDVRARIVAAASELIAAGGRDAATTRAVAVAAGVQAPTIYRLFGDKRGLLDAVAEAGLAAYVAGKAAQEPHPDPVQDLRDGWDMHVAFGLAHPGLFSIMAGDPHPRASAPAVQQGLDVLRRRVRNIASAGRLKVGEDRAIALLQAMGNGTVLILLSQPEEQRDLGLSEVAREALIQATTCDAEGTSLAGPNSAASALHAMLDRVSVLTPGESGLLRELLERIANQGGRT